MKFLLMLFIFLLPLESNAESGTYKGVDYTVEPVYGREEVHVNRQDKIVVTQYFYGARVTAVYKILNLEALYTRTDRGEFLADDPGRTSGYEVERLQLGILGSYPLLSWVDGIVRAGGDAKRVTTFKLNGTEFTKKTGEPTYSPYVGFGLEAGHKRFSLTAGATIVFQGLPDDYWDNDYQLSLGIKIRI